MIEKYLRKKITRTDLETRILKTSLKEQYAKLGGMKANAIETTPKDSISNDNVVNTSPIDSTNQN
jgi:penicillin-binding protein 2